MFKQFVVRAFVVVAVVATGGIAVAAVQARDSGAPASPAAVASVTPKTTFATSEESVRVALLSACGGRSLTATLSPDESARVDQLLSERALHAAALAGNPLASGTGFQAGVDDALHVQMLDRDIAGVLCPGR